MSVYDYTDGYIKNPVRAKEKVGVSKRIALIGVMGSGKTTLGKLISEKYNVSWVDIDSEIVEDTGISLDMWFYASETTFRCKELETLKKITNSDVQVVSCGGGTPQIEKSRDFLRQWTVILLDTDPDRAFVRSYGKKRFMRPYEDFIKLCKERTEFYSDFCDYIVSTRGSLNDSVASICQLIDKEDLL